MTETQILTQEQTAALDNLFNAWLALNGMICKGGVLYKVDSKGKILLDAQNKEQRLNSNEFTIMLNDPAKGFNAFAKPKGIKINTILHDFPTD